LETVYHIALAFCFFPKHVRGELWCVIVECRGGRRWGGLGCDCGRERCCGGVVSGVAGLCLDGMGWHRCKLGCTGVVLLR